jgi:hypothetical protein
MRELQEGWIRTSCRKRRRDKFGRELRVGIPSGFSQSFSFDEVREKGEKGMVDSWYLVGVGSLAKSGRAAPNS